MAGLISTKYNPPPAGKATARGIFVQGIRYANAAAKFWPSLLDEVRAEFPGCSVVGLSAPSSCQLCRDHLFPALSLERDMEKLVGTDIGKAMKETMAELEIMGPPTSVRIRLLSEGGEELLSRDLPLDSIDSEIFPYLVVWLFEWAGIPDSLWNSSALSGKLAAEDRIRRLLYTMSFEVDNTHLSEGLYRQTVSITHAVEPIRAPA